MGRLPSFSIIVTNWNGKHHLDECLTSLKELDYPLELIEIIMFDNGSEDGSVEHVRKKYPFVSIMTSQRNIGAVGAYNTAARQAKMDYLIFLNNDTRVDPDWLGEVAKGFNNDVAVVASKIMNYYKREIYDSAGGRISFIGRGYDFNHGRLDTHETEPRYTPYACAAALAIDARTFKEIGGFNDTYFIYEDEVDLCWKVWLIGKNVLYVPKAVVYHKFGGTVGGALSAVRIFHGTKNMFCSMLENFELQNLCTALPVSVLFTAAEMLILAIKNDWGKVPVMLKAYAWNFKNISRTLRRRHFIQSRRIVTDRQLKKMKVIDSLADSVKEYFFLRRKQLS